MNESPILQPVPSAERLESLDVLRGVAVLGILVMNIQAFSMVSAAYLNPTAYGNLEGTNYAVWYLSHLLADTKFITIFSMLFGAGVALMTARAEKAGRRFFAVHYRRMLWLILFGLFHAHVFWYGDILYLYGMCGLPLWLFRRGSPRALVGFGLGSMAIGSAIMLLLGASMPSWDPEDVESLRNDWQPPPSVVEAEVAAYQGGWLDQAAVRSPAALSFETFLMFLVNWRIFGTMLVGMAFYKLDVFSARRSPGVYGTGIAIALLVGLPMIAYGAHRHFEAEWSLEYSLFYGTQFNYWGGFFVALGWIGLVMLFCRAGAVPVLRRSLAATGRMAFTNYLLQTVICTTIFYGHGFGLFGEVERAGQIGIVALIWMFQLAFSPWWLRRFRFGPAEWLWRSLTYWNRQPFRVSAAP